MRERVMMSDDPKDPRWRFRVAQKDSGLAEIVEEELTSTGPSAEVTETTARVIMTPHQAAWMAFALMAMGLPDLPPDAPTAAPTPAASAPPPTTAPGPSSPSSPR